MFCLFIVTSFIAVEDDKATLIKKTLETRINDYKLEQLEKCYEEAIAEAEITVDSIIAIELGAGPIDTLDFPRKPSKPVFESFDSLKHGNVPLEPLFRKEEEGGQIESQKDNSKY